MSLFGGPQPPPPTSPPSAQVAPATFASSPPSRLSSELPTTPTPPTERDDASQLDDDDASDDFLEDDEVDDDGDDRPNKFRGFPSAWKRHAGNELDLYNGLSQTASNNLSKHLYLAHSLQSRLRGSLATNVKPFQSKNRWFATDAQEDNWVPPRVWTAWPLEPHEVPRKWEHFGEIPDVDPEDDFTYREEGFLKGKPSRDLEEFILSIVLRKSKEQWNSRDQERHVKKTQRKFRRKQDAKVGDTVSRDDESPNSSEAGGEKETRITRESTAVSSNLQVLEKSASGPVLSRPIVTADDDAAQRLIQPAISSLLGKLDSVFAALHRSRKNLHDYTGGIVEEGDANASDATKRKGTAPKAEAAHADASSTKKRKRVEPDVEPAPVPKKARGRPRNLGNLDGEDLSVREPATKPLRGKVSEKAPRGRPKTTTLLPGETYYMRKKRLQAEAAAQAQAEAQAGAEVQDEAEVTEAEETREPQPPPQRPPQPQRSTSKRSRRTSNSSDSSDDSDAGVSRPSGDHGTSGEHAYGLRDWSEVLSTASLVGAFKPSVIQRAAQRCSNIFNESMRFHVLEERSALEEGAGKIVEYNPGFAVPPPDFDDSSNDGDEAQSEDFETSDDESETSDAEGDESRPFWDGISTNCPHTSCRRHQDPFEEARSLRLHVQTKHGYLLPTKERRKRRKASVPKLVGAVHNDGFLQPVASRHGWRSRDVGERKPGRWDRSKSRQESRTRGGSDSEDEGPDKRDEPEKADSEDTEDGEDEEESGADEAEKTAIGETEDGSESRAGGEENQDDGQNRVD
ncbi:hypothetical protein HDK64DRAFT_297801 [Phyllosticta capitalensis]